MHQVGFIYKKKLISSASYFIHSSLFQLLNITYFPQNNHACVLTECTMYKWHTLKIISRSYNITSENIGSSPLCLLWSVIIVRYLNSTFSFLLTKFRSHNVTFHNNIYLFTAIGLSPGGSGYFTCKQNMKLVTIRFKSGGLHEKHVVATWNLGNHLSVCL